MDRSIFYTSSKLLFFRASFLFILSFFLSLNVVSGTATEFSYGGHCDSFVHESKPADEEFNISPFPGRQNGYYSGGDNILNPSSDQYYSPAPKVLVFETHHVYSTDVKDVFKVEGSLIFQSSYYYELSFSNDQTFYSHSTDSSVRGALDFDLQGFWSRATGKLCMVGSSYAYSKEGKLLQLAAALKLNNLNGSSNINTLVTGTMDSLSPAEEPNYFEQISLLMFPQGSYNYTKVSEQFSRGSPGGTDVPKSSLSLSKTRTICDMFSRRGNAFELEYANGCDSSKSCNPFGDAIGYLPQVMYLSVIQCSDNKLSLRFLIEFPNNSYGGYYSSANFSTSLVGEGSWDPTRNRLCIVACQISDASSSLEKAHVGDCSTTLSLRFPAILSIRNTSNVVGEIWSEKSRNEPGFFNRIEFRNAERYGGQIQLQGLKYEYTETEKVKKSCTKKNFPINSRGQYPDGYSGDMSFSMSIIKSKGPKGRLGWGSSHPLAVGDQPDQRFPLLIPSSSSRPKNSGVESNANVSLLNISYQISIELTGLKLDAGLDPFNQSSNGYLNIPISAEGVYDAETGSLCMVGCRSLRSDNHSMDCEILVNIHFPPLNSDRKRSKIKGSIDSMREKTDRLHFEPLEFSGQPYYVSWASESIWRMDFEMIMSVISNTLAIVFVVLQIFHVRKHPGVCPSVSLLMLVILALGHSVPLVLNLEAMFVQDSQRSVWIRGGTWLELNEVVVRAVTMVAFVLHIRLLMLSWTSRCSDDKKNALWIAEKKGLYVCLPVYIAGAVIAFSVYWRKNHVDTGRHNSYDLHQIFLGGSRAYAGLILDAFLFPQIIFNMFQHSREQALSRFFYVGLTLVRLVPHGYDLYRAHNYVDIDDSYIYADPTADYYSTAWDLIIPMLGLFLAAIIYLQQRFGGRCLLPKRFRESVAYEELPVASEEQLPLKSGT